MIEPSGPPSRSGEEGGPFGPGGGARVAADGSTGWWHRHLHRLTTFAARTYFQIDVAGGEVPRRGPVLLVANHPNSLLDAAIVALAAERPARFLARAPLFRMRSIGWVVRGTGSIPVYRRVDDPDLVGRNVGTFQAVQDALAAGSAVGIFPEGLSHSEPSLVPLKTGAARIALGAARMTGGAFPILPVGITFRDGKERVRSRALVLVGKPVRWADLVAGPNVDERSPEPSPEAVRALTARIAEGLQRVTVNLPGWEDLPVVETAEAVHGAEYGRGRSRNPVRWLARVRRTARALERARGDPDGQVEELAADLLHHRRVLDGLGLRPEDLDGVPRASVAIRWTLRNFAFFGIAAPLAFLGMVLFWVPWKVLTAAEPRFRLAPDTRATYRVLGGTMSFGTWVVLLAVGARYLLGWREAVAVLAILPLLGILTLGIRQRWRNAVMDLRRLLVLRGRTDFRTRLLDRQRGLARRIRDLQVRLEEGERAPDRR